MKKIVIMITDKQYDFLVNVWGEDAIANNLQQQVLEKIDERIKNDYSSSVKDLTTDEMVDVLINKEK